MALVVSQQNLQSLYLKKNVLGNENQDDDMENFYVTFLALVQISEALICAGDDGYLY